MNMRMYAGIGHRLKDLPIFIATVMVYIGRELAKMGWGLRTGGCNGADQAFAKGAELGGGKMEIFIPWDGYEDYHPMHRPEDGSFVSCKQLEEAFAIASRFSPNWEDKSEGARKLLARNVHVILGQDLKTPVEMIVCFNKRDGGTSHTLAVANDMIQGMSEVPRSELEWPTCHNLATPLGMDWALKFLEKRNMLVRFSRYKENPHLSNFYPCPIAIDGNIWGTVEAYYQAQKFPEQYRAPFLRLSEGIDALRLAQRMAAQGIRTREDWEDVKVDIMTRALRVKFKDSMFTEVLKSTNGKLLVEDTRNVFWGIGQGTGTNMLGVLLMQLRKEV